MKKEISYLPRERDFMDQKPHKIQVYSNAGCTQVPDPVTDPIVSNNIACQEFDYTHDPTRE